MTSATDLLVVGGGIAGLTTALAAADRGLSVAVLDWARPGSASRAAAGMLAPSVEELPGDMVEPALAARDFYPSFLAALEEKTGVRVALDRSGIIQLATSPDPASLGTHDHPRAAWLDSASLAELEPAFGGHPGAVLHPDDGLVDNLALMDALERAAELHPAVRRVSAEVLSIDAGQGVALTRTSGRFEAQRIVLATGAWAGLMHRLPRPLPVRPVLGQLLRLNASTIRHVTYGAGGYLVPRGETTLVGATSEEVGFENETSLAGLAVLRGIASRAAPVLSTAAVVHHWAGLRPMSLDGHPILGADPNEPRLAYACGFSRNGILFAPWAAAQLAELLVGGSAPALSPFRVDRPALSSAA